MIAPSSSATSAMTAAATFTPGDRECSRDAPARVACETVGRHEPGHAHRGDGNDQEGVRLGVGIECIADVHQRDQGQREYREDADELHDVLLCNGWSGGLGAGSSTT
jgi:hypothetical protein